MNKAKGRSRLEIAQKIRSLKHPGDGFLVATNSERSMVNQMAAALRAAGSIEFTVKTFTNDGQTRAIRV